MPARNFEDYIIEAEHKPITLDDYAKSPATAFLRYIVGTKDAANECLLKFKTTARARTYPSVRRDGQMPTRHLPTSSSSSTPATVNPSSGHPAIPFG